MGFRNAECQKGWLPGLHGHAGRATWLMLTLGPAGLPRELSHAAVGPCVSDDFSYLGLGLWCLPPLADSASDEPNLLVNVFHNTITSDTKVATAFLI